MREAAENDSTMSLHEKDDETRSNTCSEEEENDKEEQNAMEVHLTLIEKI